MRVLILTILTATSLLAQGRQGGGRFLTWDESLNLTTEQMQQITALREAMQPAMQGIRQTTRTLELELRQLQRSQDPDQNRIAELEAAIQANQSAMDALMSNHRLEIRSLLSADQQVIFDQHGFGPPEDRGQRRGGRRGSGMGSGSRGSGMGSGRR